MPILGIIASGISGHLNPPYDPSGYDALAFTTLASATNSVLFAGVPSGYKSLQIRCYILTTGAADINVRFNNDSSSAYSYHALYAAGSTPAGLGGGSLDKGYLGYSTTSSYAMNAILDVMDYSSSTKNKTAICLSGQNSNGATTYTMLTSSAWYNTSAITSVTMLLNSGNFDTGTTFGLYGVK